MGNLLTPDLTDDADIAKKRGSFYSNVTKVLSMFGFLQCNVKQKLFDSYCNSFYGSQLWDLSMSSINVLCVAWNKAVRRLWKLPTRCHTNLLPHIIGKLYIVQQLELRYVKIFISMLNSENETMCYIARRAKYLTNGTLGRNNVYISCKYSVPMYYINVCSLQNIMYC